MCVSICKHFGALYSCSREEGKKTEGRNMKRMYLFVDRNFLILSLCVHIYTHIYKYSMCTYVRLFVCNHLLIHSATITDTK